jgi:hypothetical protein
LAGGVLAANGRLVSPVTVEIALGEAATKGDGMAAAGRSVTPRIIEGSPQILPGIRFVSRRKEH